MADVDALSSVDSCERMHALDDNDRFRVLGFVCDYVVKHEEVVDAFVKGGWIDYPLDLVEDGDDVLQQLNAIELVNVFASSQRVIRYLFEQGLEDVIVSMLECDEGLIIGAAIHLVGTLVEKTGDMGFDYMAEAEVPDKLLKLYSSGNFKVHYSVLLILG